MDTASRITADPAVMGGRPCIRGQRVTDDIRAALEHAAWLVEAERRVAQVEDGSARTYPLDEVLEEARSRLK